MWLAHWDFIFRVNEKREKKDREENEVIGLSLKPQCLANKRGKVGGVECTCCICFRLEFFHTHLSDLSALRLLENKSV